eukprot:gnl/TRDRNA2_/TRDRNA2_60706_c0_seq1.p1 gnl/TRDRNA2_/TRDRNA2_60706_c0~~gnl/TRDRNA2_/TRDRNA2_60706_c0_seq1.p1  ORF type:complete len:237 (+),score=26.78 gnl/TRDRNA2_/TRDRNA2_60706_c0_seq1:48-713(+)
MSEVRRLGSEIRAKYPVLDGLINNAGTIDGDYTGSRQETAEGNEYVLAVNVLAPFLLTSILLPAVQRAVQGRILITSSISQGNERGLLDLQQRRGWSKRGSYALSKLCDAMIAMELHTRYAQPPRLTVNTMDPGTVNTKMLIHDYGPIGIPASQADDTFHLVTDEKLSSTSGAYFVGQRKSREERDYDAEERRQLWMQLVELTGAEYPNFTDSGAVSSAVG